MYIIPLKSIHVMKKIFFGFIRACIAIALLILVAIVLASVVSVVGVFIGVLMAVIFVLTMPVLIYKGLVRAKK